MDAGTLPWERRAMIGSNFPQIKQITEEIDDAIWWIHDQEITCQGHTFSMEIIYILLEDSDKM